MSFRGKEFFVCPFLPSTTLHVWTIKTSNQLEKPRGVIVGLQTSRKSKRNVDNSWFDHCNLSNIKLFLNSQYYPYNSMNLNIEHNESVSYTHLTLPTIYSV